VASATPASAATTLGRTNIASACWFTTRVVLVNPGNAYSWRCQYVGATFSLTYWWYNLDLNQVCRNQFGGGAYAITVNPSQPNSWWCVR
jgi:hypothetical protein